MTQQEEEEQKGAYCWQVANQVKKCMCEHCQELLRRAEKSDSRKALEEWATQ